MERDAPFPEPMAYSFIDVYPSQSPFKEPSHEIGRKHTVTVHGASDERKAYNGVATWFPKEIVYDTALGQLFKK
jgi:hypothetical protein